MLSLTFCTRVISEVKSFVEDEKDRGFITLLLGNGERIAAIEIYHRKISASVDAFQVRFETRWRH
jgi:hypothetical protein